VTSSTGACRQNETTETLAFAHSIIGDCARTEMENVVYLSPVIAQKELALLSHGKRSHVPVRDLAHYVLNYCTRNGAPMPARRPADDSVQFLERLFQLEDPR
jgi:hypothetical protein